MDNGALNEAAKANRIQRIDVGEIDNWHRAEIYLTE